VSASISFHNLSDCHSDDASFSTLFASSTKYSGEQSRADFIREINLMKVGIDGSLAILLYYFSFVF
jgi:hypothetical protein